MTLSANRKKILTLFTTIIVVSTTFFNSHLTVFAEIDYKAEAEARKSIPIESNDIENWPSGPAIGAESAILMDADTGTILYAKNIHERLYPASTTKILTCILAAEKCSMDEIVDYSREAVFSIEKGSSNIGMDVGEKITMEQSLYGILVGSANESANAVAEHISGSIEEFVKLMNDKALELGCENSNFVNPNGLFNEDHYTSAYDLAKIGSVFFKNELLCKMSSTVTYEIPMTPTQPDDIIIHSKNKLLPGRQYSYDTLLGSKTGFTSQTRQTLVSSAKKDGLTLICVILKEESPDQFCDTVSLFDYGFDNFQKINISENEAQYSIDSTDFFNANSDVFGSSKPILTLDKDDYIVLPKTAVFKDTKSSLTYDAAQENTVAKIAYTYNDTPVGNVTVNLVSTSKTGTDFGDTGIKVTDVTTPSEKESVIFINVTRIFLIIIVIAGLLIGILLLRSIINNYQFSKRKNSRSSRKKRKRIHSEFDDFNF